MTFASRLSALPERVLDVLAGLEPPWVLFGPGCALLDAGADLERGFRDAAELDGGFSPPTLAWLLQSFPLERAPEEGRDPVRLESIRQQLLKRVRRP